MKLEIREARELPAELGHLVELGLGEEFGFVRRLVEEWQDGRNRFERPGEVLLVAWLEGALVGFGGLNVDPYQTRPTVGRIRHVYVAPAARGRGVGAALVRELVRRARPAFSRLRLATRQAAPFYEQLGFARVSEPDATHALALEPDARVEIRALERREIARLWSIDRSEVVDRVYRVRGGALALEPEHHDVRGWPPGERERDEALLLDCFDHGGSFWGAFESERLVGAAVLESRFIGRARDQLQLKFLHVGRRHRGAGLGRALFERAVARARALGARRLYVSATPSENTVRFYLRRGCRPTDDVDPALFELEPLDVHLEFDIPR